MRLITHRFKAMGGPCEVSLWLSSAQHADQLLSDLEAEVRRLESKYSRFRHDSLLNRLNRRELNGRALDKETTGLLNYADQCFELSGQLFDLSVGILHSVWSFNGGVLPESERLADCLNNVGWSKIGWTGDSLTLPVGMAIDMGGLVKEFAVDRLIQMLRKHSISGLVNLAGDIAVSGTQPGDLPWRVAITHPRGQGPIAEVPLYTGALATSGDYERFMIIEDQRYCHLLRPDTGYPALSGFSSVSVVAEQCLLAGSVATIAMLKGVDGSLWLDEMSLPYLAFDQHLNASGTIKV